jgi:hypothetical protein
MTHENAEPINVALQDAMNTMMREDKTASLSPDWTPASSKSDEVCDAAQVAGEPGSQDSRTAGVVSPSALTFKNALTELQKRRIAKFATLLLVWSLIALAIGSVAYDLLS